MSEDFYYWLPHPEHVWIPAVLIARKDDLAYFQTLDGEDTSLPEKQVNTLETVSPLSLRGGLPNLVALDEFGEGAVMHQIRQRYKADKIYTNIGDILIAVNPFKLLPIYSNAIVQQYQSDPHDAEPHVFKVAASAYRRLVEEGGKQAVVISGESGAGKTEITKSVLQYLSDVAGSVNAVEQQILQSSPVLEAFGNAKTSWNDNSSRFGRWMEVQFDKNGKIAGAEIDNYLLEKSRIVTQGRGERNYHIFYQMCRGLSSERRKLINLEGTTESYTYLKQSGVDTIQGVDDKSEFETTVTALRSLSFSEEVIDDMWLVLTAILALGNIQFATRESGRADGCTVANIDQLHIVAKNLQLSPKALEEALCYRTVSVRGQDILSGLTMDDAVDSRDALAKETYGNLFDWLVLQVNRTLNRGGSTNNNKSGGGGRPTNLPPVMGHIRYSSQRDQTTQQQPSPTQQSDETIIGILDIFGFEVVENNSFEQLCINYANEKLQMHLNDFIFNQEQQEYKKEEITVPEIEYADNTECVNLLERPPMCIWTLIDEESMVPRGSDEQLINKLHQQFAVAKPHKFYAQILQNPEIFVIKHYAGDVQYTIDGFLNKNKDKLHESITSLFQDSGLPLLKAIYNIEPSSAGPVSNSSPTGLGAVAIAAAAATIATNPNPLASNGGSRMSNAPLRRGSKLPKLRTLSSRFVGQLRSLSMTLKECHPHYIRCIKPNDQKKPNSFSSVNVLKQMKYTGLFEAIRIRKSGFQYRQSYQDFVARKRVCLTIGQLQECQTLLSAHPDKECHARVAAEFYLKCLNVDMQDVRLGTTKVFMREAPWIAINRSRDQTLRAAVLKLQAFARMLLAKRQFKIAKAMHVRLQKAMKTFDTDEIKNLVKDGEGVLRTRSFKQAQQLLRYMNEEGRVSLLLQNSFARNSVVVNPTVDPGHEAGQLEELEAALEQVQLLKARFPDQPDSPGLVEMLRHAERQRLVLLEAKRALQQLREAIIEEDVELLTRALSLTLPSEEPPTTVDSTGGSGAPGEGVPLTPKKQAVQPLNGSPGTPRSIPLPETEVQQARKLLAQLKEEEASLAALEREARIETHKDEGLTETQQRQEKIGSPKSKVALQPLSVATDNHPGVERANSSASKSPKSPRTPLRSPRSGDEEDSELEAAIEGKDLARLTEALQAHRKTRSRASTKLVRIALNTKELLEKRQRVAEGLRRAVERADVVGAKELLKEANNLDLHEDYAELVSEARHLCFWMNDEDLLVLRIRVAQDGADVTALKLLLDQATLQSIDNDVVSAARDFLQAELRKHGLGAQNVSKNPVRPAQANVKGIHAAYQAFVLLASKYPLSKCEILRAEDDYVRYAIFKKKELLAQRLVWQPDDIPKSLTKINTRSIPDKKTARDVKTLARTLFKNVRGCMGDNYHPYPVTLAFEILAMGVRYPVLRDEILCQLVKQTTGNPSEARTMLGLKLIYLCLSRFLAGPAVLPCLMSHLASFAWAELPNGAIQFDSKQGVAVNCWVAYSKLHRKLRDLNKGDTDVGVPTMDEVEVMIKGTPPPTPLNSIPASVSEPLLQPKESLKENARKPYRWIPQRKSDVPIN